MEAVGDADGKQKRKIKKLLTNTNYYDIVTKLLRDNKEP